MNKIEKLIAELFPEGVEVASIGEICQINRGRVMSKDYLRNNAGRYPVYSSQTVDDGVFGRINTYDYDGEYLTWTTDGANAGSIFYRNGKFSITNVCGLMKVKVDGVNTKFLLYILATVSKKYVSAGMGNPKIMSNVMEKIETPIPPLAIRKEIVNTLDTFTALEARKKQYEYYLDAHVAAQHILVCTAGPISAPSLQHPEKHSCGRPLSSLFSLLIAFFSNGVNNLWDRARRFGWLAFPTKSVVSTGVPLKCWQPHRRPSRSGRLTQAYRCACRSGRIKPRPSPFLHKRNKQTGGLPFGDYRKDRHCAPCPGDAADGRPILCRPHPI